MPLYEKENLESFLFLLFMLELFTSKFKFLIQEMHKIRALFSFCISFWIHLFNSILIEKGLSCLKNAVKTSLQILMLVVSLAVGQLQKAANT